MSKEYKIEGFWTGRLGVHKVRDANLVHGWRFVGERKSTFVEAPLSGIGDGYTKVDPDEAKVILVSAPGAVGKSTLAAEIACATGSVLVDLAKTDAVGANFLTGGLADGELLGDFKSGELAVLVDGLDEARIRVTSDGFAGFIADVAKLARHDGRRPVVLLGRTGAILETWVYLDDQGITPAVLEIKGHSIESARHLAKLALDELRNDDYRDRAGPDPATTQSADNQAVDLLIDGLKKETATESSFFVGYAPVLQAVARQVRAFRNPSDLVSQIQKDNQPVTLIDIVMSIMEREKRKLDALQLQDPGLKEALYNPDEQVGRLISRLYRLPFTEEMPSMNPADRETYEKALETWVGEHPFLDGAGQRPSSEVFAGYIAYKALCNPQSAEAARALILNSSTTINPFISLFYLPNEWDDQPEDKPFSNLSDLPIIFASLSAQIPQGDSVHLSVVSEAPEDGEAEEVEVEITRTSPNWDTTRYMRFVCKAGQSLKFGSILSNVDISGDNLDVEIASGAEVVIASPSVFDVRSMVLNASKLTIEQAGPTNNKNEIDVKGKNAIESAVILRSTDFRSSIQTRPVVREGTQLSVYFPGCETYPWQEFSTKPSEGITEDIFAAYQRLTKILLPFKSDRYGELAKYRGFVDHKRRIKGHGKKVRDQLVDDKIIYSRQYLYVLNADLFQETLGLNYHMMQRREMPAKTIDFLRRALKRKD